MRRLMLFTVGLLFVVTAAYLSLHLARTGDLLILASVSPAIVAAFALGIILLLRVFRRSSPGGPGQALTPEPLPEPGHESAEADDTDEGTE